MKATIKQITERLNDWIGCEHHFTTECVEHLTWALAMDQDLSDKFSGAVRDMRNDMTAEMETVTG